mgnify:CR=1 FL=1
MNINLKPKYIEIAEYLKELIKENKNDRLPSQTELSYKFKVSHMTIRKAFDILERDGLILRKKGRGTYINRIEKDRNILDAGFLIVLPRISLQNDPFFATIFNGIIKEEKEKNIKLSVLFFNDDTNKIQQEIETNKSKVIVWFIPRKDDYKFLEELRSRGFFVISINRRPKNSHISYITTDNKDGGYILTKHLIDSGCKRIGFVGINKDLEFTVERYLGYKKVLKETNLSIDERVVLNLNGLINKGVLYKGVKDIIDRKVDGILCSGSSLFPEIPKVIKEKGLRVGQDIKIATFDEIDNEDIGKKIWQGIQQLEKMGELAIEEGLNILRGRKTAVKIYLPIIVKGPVFYTKRR